MGAFMVIVSLAIASLVLGGCRPSAEPTFVPPPTADPVSGDTYTVKSGTIVETVEVRGRVAARQEMALMFPVGGALKEVHVLPGDQVEEGTLLAELDAPQIKQTALTRQYDLMLAEASLLKAQLRLAQAGSPETAISPDMSPEEVLARISPERAMLELDVEMARLRLERASALHVIASERLSSTQLIASFPGLIISLEKDAGDQVGAYEPFGTLADPTDLWVLATVLEENVSDIVVGQPVDIILDAFPEKTFTGSVLQVSSKPIVWQGENAYEVTITFDEGQEIPATINMGANVQVTGETREDVLIVPTRALITIGDQSYVEVVQDNGDVERVMVETGLSNAADTEIVAGLKTGQVIRIP